MFVNTGEEDSIFLGRLLGQAPVAVDPLRRAEVPVEPLVGVVLPRSLGSSRLYLLRFGRSSGDVPDLLGQFIICQLFVDLVTEEGLVELSGGEVAPIVTAAGLDNNARGVHVLPVASEADASVVLAPSGDIAASKRQISDILWPRLVLNFDVDGPRWVEAHKCLGSASHVLSACAKSFCGLSYMCVTMLAGSGIVGEVDRQNLGEFLCINVVPPVVAVELQDVCRIQAVFGCDKVLGHILF